MALSAVDSLQDLNPYVLGAIGAVTVLLSYFLLRSDPEAPVSYHVEPPEEARPRWEGKVLEQPALKVPGSSSVQCYCPATGESLGVVSADTPEDIDRAIAKAKAAQVEWAKTTFAQRRKVLKTMLKFVLENQDILARVACLDSGKTMVDASLGEVLVTAEKLKWTIDHGEESLKPERRPTSLLMMYKSNEVIWQPLGLVAACVSWNYPFHNVISPIIASIFAGNGIIVKGSEATAWSSTYVIKVATEALVACGHSPDLVQSVVCWPSEAGYLTSHPSISHITFIGSRPVAHHVCRSAAKALTPVCVELGGKDPAILLDDLSSSEFKRIASILMRGTFQSAGQNCIGIERVIAMPKVYDKLVAHLTPLIRGLRLGSILHADPEHPVDIGATISATNFDKLEELISEAVSQGARLLAGGKRYIHPKFPKGHYFTPTLLVDVTKDMRIANTELFAPVFLMMRASTIDECISLANSTEYALGASVYGSRKSDLERVVREVHSGMVAVNDFAVFYMVQLPFGGMKGSGYGRFAGKEGLRGVCNMKSITRDRWPGVKTSIPAPMDLPIKDLEAAWKMACGVVLVGYGDWKGKIRGIKGLIGL